MNTPKYKKISDTYYTIKIIIPGKTCTFEVAPNAKSVELAPKYTKKDFFFVFENYVSVQQAIKPPTKASTFLAAHATPRWYVVHAATGLTLVGKSAKTKQLAIDFANERLNGITEEEFLEHVNTIIAKYKPIGLSPQFKLIDAPQTPSDEELLNFAMLEMARQLTRKKSSN